MALTRRGGKWVPAERQAWGGYRVGQRVLAVVPSGDRDEREVVTVVAFHRRDDGVMRVNVADDDGVRCWIGGDMIERHV